uniref:quinolinate synthase NadA n=1 Tax=Bacillus sp. P14.5 TaxID=1983400 RepID=UPI0013B05EFB
NGGATVTSSNAHDIVRWALEAGERILFLPDQHLGRNTAFDLGVPLEAMAVWDPLRERLVYEGDIEDVRVILWKGHCSVHEKFNVAQIEALRKNDPERNIIVHPECTFDVVQAADEAGSTSYIIDQIEASAPGTKWAVGTEMNLVNRLAATHPEQDIVSLNPYMCPCLTMNRIDLPHLLWALESLETDPVNIIRVDKETTKWATLALERMLAH